MEVSQVEGLTHHRQAVRSFVLRFTRDAALADDIVQETFIRAQKNHESYRGDAKERSWLCAIALNLVRDHSRATRRQPLTTSEPEVLNGIESPEDNAEAAILKNEMSECISEHLQRLESPQFDVVALHDMAGWSHAEIADHLGITVANARVILHRGHVALQKILEANCRLSIGRDDTPCERLPVSGKDDG